MKQLICDNLHGERTRCPVPQPCQTGMQDHWNVQQLGARCRGWRAIQEAGLLSTVEDGLREQERASCIKRVPEERQAAMEAGCCCWSHVTGAEP